MSEIKFYGAKNMKSHTVKTDIKITAVKNLLGLTFLFLIDNPFFDIALSTPSSLFLPWAEGRVTYKGAAKTAKRKNALLNGRLFPVFSYAEKYGTRC